VASIAAVLAGAWDVPAMLLLAGGVGALGIGASWWAASAWTGVDVEVRVDPPRAVVGERIALVVRIANRRRHAIPIVRVVARLPEGLHAGASPAPTAFPGYRRRMTLPAGAETELRLPLSPSRRGEHFLPPVDIALVDPFEMAPVTRSFDPDRPLLVLPDPMGGIPLRVKRRLPFGTPVPGARLFEDREHIAGVRDYTAGDPMHHVHWRASAHAGRLQTKTFEATRSAEVMFALDLSTGEPFWEGVDPTAAEETIGWAASLARQAALAGWRTGLVANTHLRRGRGPVRVPALASPARISAVFTALARIPSQPTSDLGPVLREVGRRLTRPTTVVVISHEPGPSLIHEMARLRRRGADVMHVSPSAPVEAG
jgi:uncharacterized protein (DUF58 family)